MYWRLASIVIQNWLYNRKSRRRRLLMRVRLANFALKSSTRMVVRIQFQKNISYFSPVAILQFLKGLVFYIKKKKKLKLTNNSYLFVFFVTYMRHVVRDAHQVDLVKFEIEQVEIDMAVGVVVFWLVKMRSFLLNSILSRRLIVANQLWLRRRR